MNIYLISGILLVGAVYCVYFSPRYIKSTVDGKYYTVKNTMYRQQAADTLASLNTKVNTLLKDISEYNKKNDNFSRNIALLENGYSDNILGENLLSYGTSYTINKGSYVGMCVANKETGAIYDSNILMFVLIHELSHIGCESVGHTPEFIRFFQFLLKRGINCGVYVHDDYNKTSKEYCGITINASPI